MTTAKDDLVAAIDRVCREYLAQWPVQSLIDVVVAYNEVADEVLSRVASGQMKSVRTAGALREVREKARALGL
jgi:hypothetical protein